MKRYMFDFAQADDLNRFEEYIMEWIANNKYAIVEAGGDVKEYFRRNIEEQQNTSGFWIDDEQVEFVSNMDRALDRVEAQWKETGFNTVR